MNLIILKTDIKTKEMLNEVRQLFNTHSNIIDWSVDTEDIDHVLRVETNKNASEREFIQLLQTCGFHCELLPD